MPQIINKNKYIIDIKKFPLLRSILLIHNMIGLITKQGTNIQNNDF
jgi:hypothetical protein